MADTSLERITNADAIDAIKRLREWLRVELKEHNTRLIKQQIIFSTEEMEWGSDHDVGFCIDCGAEHEGCEVEAANCQCEACGHDSVFGTDEISQMGLVNDG